MSTSQAERMFDMAERVAKQATCPRASVGCVIVRPSGQTLVAANGASGGVPTCLQDGCLIEGGHCVRAVHAEVRLVALAARQGIRLEGAMAFTTLLPCVNCMQALHLAGVNIIYYDKSYEREEREHVHRLAEGAGVQLIERSHS